MKQVLQFLTKVRMCLSPVVSLMASQLINNMNPSLIAHVDVYTSFCVRLRVSSVRLSSAQDILRLCRAKSDRIRQNDDQNVRPSLAHLAVLLMRDSGTSPSLLSWQRASSPLRLQASTSLCRSGGPPDDWHGLTLQDAPDGSPEFLVLTALLSLLPTVEGVCSYHHYSPIASHIAQTTWVSACRGILMCFNNRSVSRLPVSHDLNSAAADDPEDTLVAEHVHKEPGRSCELQYWACHSA